MKKVLLIIAIIALSAPAFAQGNLEFNQVINLTYTGGAGYNLTVVGNITVPSGKVWKIVSASLTSNSVQMMSVMTVGDHLVCESSGKQNNAPIWYGPGNYGVSLRNFNAIISTGSLSIIEFNVVP